MAIGRNNSRRRRVVLEEAVQSGGIEKAVSEVSEAGKSAQLQRIYSDAARRDGQLKTTDLIPKTIFSFTIVIIGVLTVGVLINLAAWRASEWGDYLSPSAMQSVSLSGVGSISRWFSSFLLMLTGMASLQIYAMRRHRCDDYNGAYQIWLWMAVLLALASVNCVVDFRSIVESLRQQAGFTGNSTLAILLLTKFVALSALVVRGIIEIRASRAAVVAVILVWVAYTSAVITQIPGVKQRLVGHYDILYGNSILVGTLATFIAALTYARFVYLHANDLIQLQRSVKAKQEKSRVTANASAKVKSTSAIVKDSAEVKSTPSDNHALQPRKKGLTRVATSQAKPRQKADSAAKDNSVADDPSVQQEILSLSEAEHLSKSERRRLKKLQKRQRRAA